MTERGGGGGALGMRLAAGGRMGGAAISVIGLLVNRWLSSRAWLGSGSTSEITDRFILVSRIQRWTGIGAILLVVVGLALFFAAQRRGPARRLAAAALAATAIDLVLLVFDNLVPAHPIDTHPVRFSAWREALWSLRGVSLHAAELLAVAAGARALHRRFGDYIAAYVLAVFAGATVAFDVVVRLLPASARNTDLVTWGWYALSLGSGISFGVAALQLAGALARGGGVPRHPVAAPAIPAGGDPTPFRLFGWANVLRAVLGIPLAVGTVIAAAQRAFDAAQLALLVGALAGLAVSGMLITSLAGQLRLPGALRNGEALRLALFLAWAGLLFDLAAAVAMFQLLSAAAAATRGSYWDVPSIGSMEVLQLAATWLGRGAVVAGFIGGLAIVRSLATTARGIGSAPLVALAGRVTGLLIATGLAVLAVFIVVSMGILRMSGTDIAVLLTLAAALLVLALVTFIQLLMLAFGLAGALEPGPHRMPPGPPATASF